MTSKNKFYLFGLGIIIIFLVIPFVLGVARGRYFSSQKVINNDQSEIIAPPAKTATSTKEVLTNAKGQKWILPATADFTVSTASGSPINFLEGKIEPLKVHPGDTQNMRLVIMSASGLSGVRAEIETDRGTTTVELNKTGTLAVKELDPRLATYIIDAQNKLQILSPAEAAAYRQKEIAAEASSSSGINSALAATGGREIWEGSWLVKDTSVRTYHTVFTATDTAGNQDSLILAWSDPCNPVWPVSGSFTATANCTISSNVGVDAGNLTIGSGKTITLSSALYFNSGQSIIPSSGSYGPGQIVINTGGFFSKAYVYYVDQDKDGYAADGGGGLPTVMTSSSAGDASNYAYLNGSTWARRGMKPGAPDPYVSVDCNDADAAKFKIYPGTFYTDIDGDGYRPAYPTTVSNICAGASMPSGWTTNTTGTDCLDSDVNFKPSQVNWWTSSATNLGDYNCSGVTELAWADNNTAGMHTPAQTTAGVPAPEIACSSYNGTQYTTTYCGQALNYTGSLFVFASGITTPNTCDGARAGGNLRYWGAGPIISVCQ